MNRFFQPLVRRSRLPSAPKFYLTDCTFDTSRNSNICELRGSNRQFADMRKIFHVKVVVVRCLLSHANTECSWGRSVSRTMSAFLQVFTYPSRHLSLPHHTEAVQRCHTCTYQARHLYLLNVSGSMFTCGIMVFRFSFFPFIHVISTLFFCCFN